MEKIDWAAIGKAFGVWFLKNVLPLLLASLGGAAAYDQGCKPVVQAVAGTGGGCDCTK